MTLAKLSQHCQFPTSKLPLAVNSVALSTRIDCKDFKKKKIFLQRNLSLMCLCGLNKKKKILNLTFNRVLIVAFCSKIDH